MKKAVCLLLVVLMVCGLSACGAPTDVSSQTPDSSSQLSDVIPQESKPTGNNIAENKDAAVTLIANLNLIDRLGGAAVELDRETTFPQGNTLYFRVNDPRFTALSQISDLLKSTLTDELIAQRYSALIEGDSPMFLEKNGVLYCKDAAKGCGFSLTGDVTVNEAADGSFIAEQSYDDFGSTSTLVIHAVPVDGGYRIASFETR